MSQYDRKANNSTNYVHPNESNLWDLHYAMDYDPSGKPTLRTGDSSVAKTTRNRQKVSTQEIIYFNTFQYDKDPATWDETSVGTGNATFDPVLANVVLEVGADAGAEIVRQTRTTIQYTPSRQNQLSFAIRAEEFTEGVRSRAGVFDESNGVYFENNGLEFTVVIRYTTDQGVQERRANRSEWNVDKMDGTGPSGIFADIRKQQLLVIEYEWYGAGEVSFRLVIDDVAYTLHRFYNANNVEQTWAQTVVLPLRFELTNLTGAPGTHRYYQGSMSVLAEGDKSAAGREFNAASPIEGRALTSALVFFPILSIRLRPNRLNAIAFLTEFQAAALDNSNMFYRVYRRAQLTGAVWNNSNSGSFVEYDTSATEVSGGTIFKTGFVNAGSQGLPIQFFRGDVVNQLSRENMGTEGEIVTIAVASQGTNKSVFASLSWVEIK